MEDDALAEFGLGDFVLEFALEVAELGRGFADDNEGWVGVVF